VLAPSLRLGHWHRAIPSLLHCVLAYRHRATAWDTTLVVVGDCLGPLRSTYGNSRASGAQAGRAAIAAERLRVAHAPGLVGTDSLPVFVIVLASHKAVGHKRHPPQAGGCAACCSNGTHNVA
jgi:hypothetical protein